MSAFAFFLPTTKQPGIFPISLKKCSASSAVKDIWEEDFVDLYHLGFQNGHLRFQPIFDDPPGYPLGLLTAAPHLLLL